MMLEFFYGFFERTPKPNNQNDLARRQYEQMLESQKSEREAAVSKYGEKYVSHFERVAWLKMRIRESQYVNLYGKSQHDIAMNLAKTNDWIAELNKLESNPPTKKPHGRTAGLSLKQ